VIKIPFQKRAVKNLKKQFYFSVLALIIQVKKQYICEVLLR